MPEPDPIALPIFTVDVTGVLVGFSILFSFLLMDSKSIPISDNGLVLAACKKHNG
jgi:hypothetical protein